MSMIPGIDDDRLSNGQGPSSLPSWYGESLEPQPVATDADGISGNVSVIAHLSPEGGMTYEQTEPVEGRQHRTAPAHSAPYKVRKT